MLIIILIRNYWPSTQHFKRVICIMSPTYSELDVCFVAYEYISNIISTLWDRVTCICVRKVTIIGSDNGLSPARRQAIIWTNDGILLNRSLGTNFGEILIKTHIFAFDEMYLKMSSAIFSRPRRIKMIIALFFKFKRVRSGGYPTGFMIAPTHGIYSRSVLFHLSDSYVLQMNMYHILYPSCL